jgi:nitroreductase
VSDQLAFGLDAGLWDVMSTMRAMRRLKPDPVPRELLEQLVRAATWAPSGGNAQAYSWLVVTDRAALAALDPIWAKCLALYWATVGQADSDTMDAAQHAALRRATEYQRDHFTEIPALLVACYRTESPLQRLRHDWRGTAKGLAALGARDAVRAALASRRAAGMAEAASMYPAVQNVLLTARALGLGATLTTLHLTFERQFKRVLGIPRGVSTFAVIPVGYPRGRFGPVRRKAVDEVIHWNRF